MAGSSPLGATAQAAALKHVEEDGIENRSEAVKPGASPRCGAGQMRTPMQRHWSSERSVGYLLL